MAKHETTADVIAAMRDEAARADMEQDYSINDAAEMMREFAWRFEAALKRKSVTGGNQLRDALVKARRFIDSSPLVYIEDDTGTIARGELCAEIDAALAAPATAEKSSAVGDVAKLREALMSIWKEVYFYAIEEDKQDFAHLHEAMLEDPPEYKDLRNSFFAIAHLVDTTLAAPPRNCDRFATVDEARKAHEAICEKYGKCHHGCPLNNDEHYSAFDCFEAWLFAPATEKEGGRDGNE